LLESIKKLYFKFRARQTKFLLKNKDMSAYESPIGKGWELVPAPEIAGLPAEVVKKVYENDFSGVKEHLKSIENEEERNKLVVGIHNSISEAITEINDAKDSESINAPLFYERIQLLENLDKEVLKHHSGK
jgi:hypothetical protein